jgi:hypothetical protein
MAHGGKRKGAGRKPKADEVKMIERMDAVLAPTEVWQKLADKVKEKDVQAIKTWLGYRFGMPKQTVDQNSTVEIKKTVLEQSDIDQLTSLDDV